MRDKGLALVFLCRAVGVDVVDVREVSEELGGCEVQGLEDIEEGGAPGVKGGGVSDEWEGRGERIGRFGGGGRSPW